MCFVYSMILTCIFSLSVLKLGMWNLFHAANRQVVVVFKIIIITIIMLGTYLKMQFWRFDLESIANGLSPPFLFLPSFDCLRCGGLNIFLVSLRSIGDCLIKQFYASCANCSIYRSWWSEIFKDQFLLSKFMQRGLRILLCW